MSGTKPKAQPASPAAVAMVAASLAAQAECLRSDSDIMFRGSYRKGRIHELVALALDFLEESERQIEERGTR